MFHFTRHIVFTSAAVRSQAKSAKTRRSWLSVNSVQDVGREMSKEKISPIRFAFFGKGMGVWWDGKRQVIYKFAILIATYSPLLKSSMLKDEGYSMSPLYVTGGSSYACVYLANLLAFLRTII